MQVDLDKIAYASWFPGLGNYDEATLSISVPAQTLDGTASETIEYNTSQAIDRAYAITQVRVQLDGLDGNYYIIKSSHSMLYSNTTRVYPLLSATYGVSIYTYFDGGIFKVELQIYSLDLADSTVTIPAFTANVSLKLCLPPFETS